MIPIQGETLIPLRDVPRQLPAKSNAKRVHISACYRWVSTGVHGVVLESLKVGGTTYTSIEALERFAHKLSRRTDVERAERIGDPTTRATRAKSHATAERLELELALPRGCLASHQPPAPRHSEQTNGHR